jgi:hypothetical protein
MVDISIYYCWACDAHRRAAVEPDGRAHCPDCQRELTADSRLPIRFTRLQSATSVPAEKWPAPVRPRLAASA